ncbi:sensor histidine kinase [Methanoculleus bourgensis]|uniref:histidine kinase n=1 Tax=Methanoculleus bourgensis TaxID=83986 RepID=A0A0X3BGW1_9EURY|nr:PAS domain S-box protein [Methanoculleus bourgensis]CVK31332.1 Multi-sensor signal transduction histidine kinase [Methanoculleus bourgensis]
MTPIRPPGTIYEAPPEYRILDGVNDWYLLVGEDHKIVWANTAFRRVLGVPEGDLWQAIHALGGGGDLAGRILAALKDEDEVPEFECRIRDLEGGERRCLCSGRKAPSDEGWLLWFREFPDAGDYEKIVEYTGTATILIEDGGTISVANTEFERLSGYPRREIVGVKRLTDFVPRAEELRRITGYHTLRRSDPLAAPKNYSFSFADRAGNIHTVEATIGMIPGTNRSVMSLLDVTGRRRAEQALQESEERLNLALMAANDGLVDWDVGTGTIFYSPRCFTMLGYEPGEFVPTVSSLLSLVHPEDRDRVEAALTGMATGGGRDRLELEFRARSASGRWIYVLDRLQVVSRDADGMPLRIVGTHSDITERKAAERELLVRKMAMESSLSAIAIADLDGYLTYANQALLEMGGLTDRGEILGRHLSEFWVGPGKVREVLRTLAERGKCSEELTGRRADGTEFTAHINVNIVTERSGDPVCIMATAVDVTEQRRMEEALRESEKRYRALAESAPDIIFLVDMEGNALYVNSAGGRLLDREPGALQGMNVREMFPPRIAERWVAMLRKAAEPAAGSLTEETLLPGDDGGTWLETRLIPMTESDGTVRNLLGISRDVTRRKRVEEQLQFQALVLGQVDDAVIAVDADGRITYMNRAAERLYGVSSSEALGRLNTDFFTYEWLRPDDEEEAQTALQDPGIWRGVTIHRKRDGEALFVDATLSALEDDRGNATGMLCSLRDITEQKRADLELRIKDMAIASSLGAVALADLEGRIIYVNRASLAVHGWEREEEVIGKPFSMIWADREEGERTRVEALRNGAWLGEMEAQRCDGTTFPMQLALSVVTDESGRPLCLMGSGIDISQRKLAEQDLRIRDMAIASSLNAFTISDLDGRLTYVNQAFLSMWGYTSAAEVLGRSITEFWQDEEDATDALRALLVSGRYVGERIGKRRDGTGFYVMFSASLVTNDAGAPICLMASIADITDLKRAEAEIQAHNRKLSVLNQIIGVSTSATDIEEALEDVLAATIALLDLRGGGIYLVEPGRQSARLVCIRGMLDDFIPPPGVPDITVPPYADVFVAGEPLFVDDPGERDIPPYASIPIVAPGRVVGSLNLVPHDHRLFADADRSLLVAIGREIGSSIERTLLIRQLEEAQREANLYLDILSHDIRNAENVSSLYTDLLINMLEGEARGYAQRLRSSIRKSIEILRNVSTIRRIHHESTILVPVDLDQVIQDEIEIFSEVTFHYEGTDLAVMADPLLPEVFTNLIGNAIKFGGPTVKVTIRVEESGDDVLVSIEDTGPGIPDEMKEAVFMRFGKNRSRKSGQGLGLYITRMLIERYGGRIRVDDRVPGHPECGAAFRFTLKRTT